MILICHDLFSFVLLQPGIGDRLFPFFFFFFSASEFWRFLFKLHVMFFIYYPSDRPDNIRVTLVCINKRFQQFNRLAQGSHFYLNRYTELNLLEDPHTQFPSPLNKEGGGTIS
jgi:hypothetical protein